MAHPLRFPSPAGAVDVLLIAGEHSGDQHGARLIKDLFRKNPSLKVAALGGPEIARSGAQFLFDLTASSVVGFVEVVKNLPFFKQVFEATLSWISEYKPRAVVFVDYPGLNLRLAKAMFERGLSRKAGGPIRALYYISPQIWAWKAGRRFKMAEHLDGMAVIFPFEIESYGDTRLPVEFVGHPFVERDYEPPVAYDKDAPVLLLPGSRRQAVRRIFPPMLAGFQRFGERGAVVICPSRAIEETLRAANPPANVEIRRLDENHAVEIGAASSSAVSVAGQARTPIPASAVLTSSGTMSMHCALAAIPGAIVYRTNPITYLIARRLVKIPFIGIANLLLREAVYPEYIQGAAQPEALGRELRDCIHNLDRVRRTAELAAKLRAILRQPTSGSAAEWVEKFLR